MTTDPTLDQSIEQTAARFGRRGFLGAAAAVTGSVVFAPVAAAAPQQARAAAVVNDKPAPINQLPPGAVSLVPIQPGAVQSAISRLDDIIRDVLNRTGVPGLAAAVVHDDTIKFARAYGVRDLTTGLPVTVDTVFQLASVSKPLASTVIARAVGDGRLDWTDPIVKYRPSFALKDPYVGAHVTVEDMLSHRSGLPAAAGDLLEDLGYQQDYVLGKLVIEPLTPMRTTYAYSDFGYTAGAVAAAGAVGLSWEDMADILLFGPLGMTSTSYRHSDFVNEPNHTAMHARINGTWQQAYQRNADPQAPAGGANSSVMDLTRWLRLHLADGVWEGKQLIPAGALARTRQPVIPLSPPSIPISRTSLYGLGFDLSDDAAARVRWSHSGAFFQGASTAVLMLPSANLGLVVLTNGMPVGAPEAIGAYFLDYVEAGKFQRDWLAGYGAQFAADMANQSQLAPPNQPPANPAPAKPNAFYAGTYQNSFYGPITITPSLHLLIGPHPNDYPLTHWDGNVFSFYPTGENAVGITAATFTPNPAGTQAGSVTLEYYNDDGLGTFTR